MKDHVCSSGQQVTNQKAQSRAVVGLHEAVTASDAVPAQHHQILAYVATGAFEYMMKREVIGLATETALTPFVVELA